MSTDKNTKNKDRQISSLRSTNEILKERLSRAETEALAQRQVAQACERQLNERQLMVQTLTETVARFEAEARVCRELLVELFQARTENTVNNVVTTERKYKWQAPTTNA